jgi:signal transduction histidine kinase/CHASE3 domain sensor protein/DNA-binding NarL/FixJ family response regulator
MKDFANASRRFCGSFVAAGTIDVTGHRRVFAASGSSSVSGPAESRIPGFRLSFPISSFILAIGFAVLAAISTASIALDVRSRTEASWVHHTLEVSNKLTDLRLLLRRAESAGRGYLLNGDPLFVTEFNQSFDGVGPGYEWLKQRIKDNPSQEQLLAAGEQLVDRKFAVAGEMMRLYAAGDSAGVAALGNRADGRALMESIGANFDQLAAEEQRLLGIRSAASQQTGSLLLTVDLCCTALILVLVTLLMREGLRSSRKLNQALSAAGIANESLETAVAERTAHLLVAHEKLRHSTSVIENTFASMAEAVLVVDNEEKIVLSNAAAERLLQYCPGMTMAELRTQNVTSRSDGSTPLMPSERPTARALRGEQFDGLEIVVRRAGSRDPLQFLVSGRPLYDTSGAISGGALVLHDMTAARETERKLQQSQKLDAIGRLTGGVAHDFNNMLTVIAGTTEILVADLGNRPDLQAVAALINQAADRCTELIQQLLAFARKQPLQPRNVDLNATIADIGKLLRPTLGGQIEISLLLEKGLATACIDPSQLTNALINLAINARDAMPDGGKLMLETASVVLDEAYAQGNPDVGPGAYAMIAVSDTGTGMSAEMCEKVFEPFFTTKETGKGTGLGMSMVYGFVKQSGGHIKIYSEEGHGTSIKLYLPAARGCVDAAVAIVLPTRGAGETILVVEDDALVRGFVTAQLDSLGYRTIAVADSAAALAHLERGQPIDLLFTDVVMPGGMTGRQLAAEVTRRRPGTKILYTSGYTENSIVHHGRLDRGVLLLSKPYRRSALASMVRLALGDKAIECAAAPPSLRAGTSIAIPMLRQPASLAALSSR